MRIGVSTFHSFKTKRSGCEIPALEFWSSRVFQGGAPAIDASARPDRWCDRAGGASGCVLRVARLMLDLIQDTGDSSLQIMSSTDNTSNTNDAVIDKVVDAPLTIEIDAERKNTTVFRFRDVPVSYIALIQRELLSEPDTQYAGYTQAHPLSGEIKLTVVSKLGHTVTADGVVTNDCVNAFARAVKRLITEYKELNSVIEKFSNTKV